ncbi:unnamed protein product [Blepharisma stoltei]|uniref:Uncharacterized protein n=1 Tax=Blepharisma stoltei TaxID=1481888 RepID=A0AAU9J1N0_9CILI|nr:unnamed protein product [Blepharisma stoltei]
MKFTDVLFLFLIGFSVGLEYTSCHTVTCGTGITSSECISISSSDGKVTVTPCTTGLQCQDNGQFTSTTGGWNSSNCTTAISQNSTTSLIRQSAAGYPCSSNSDCASNTCQNGICQGIPEGQNCTLDDECQPNHYCYIQSTNQTSNNDSSSNNSTSGNTSNGTNGTGTNASTGGNTTNSTGSSNSTNQTSSNGTSTNSSSENATNSTSGGVTPSNNTNSSTSSNTTASNTTTSNTTTSNTTTSNTTTSNTTTSNTSSSTNNTESNTSSSTNTTTSNTTTSNTSSGNNDTSENSSSASNSSNSSGTNNTTTTNTARRLQTETTDASNQGICMAANPVDTACTSDTQCQVGYGCNNLVCTKLFSVAVGTAASSSKFCATNLVRNGVCEGIVIVSQNKTLSSPYQCSIGSDCIYQYKTDGANFTTDHCQCDGTSTSVGYCGMVSGVIGVWDQVYPKLQYTVSNCSGTLTHTDDIQDLIACGSLSNDTQSYYNEAILETSAWTLYQSGAIDKCASSLGLFAPNSSNDASSAFVLVLSAVFLVFI